MESYLLPLKQAANTVTFFEKSNQKTFSSTEPDHCFHL